MEQQFKAAQRRLFTINAYYEFLAELMQLLQIYIQDMARLSEYYSRAGNARSDQRMNLRDLTDALRDPHWIMWMHIGDACRQSKPAIYHIRQELELIAANYRLRTGMSLWDRVRDLNDNIKTIHYDTMAAALSAIRAFALNLRHSVVLRYKLQGAWMQLDVQKELARSKTII